MTLDPRIPALGAWQPVEMSNAPAVVIDLSQASWDGDDALASLSDRELDDLMDALDEADAEDYRALPGGDGEDDLTDDELADLMQAAEADAEDGAEGQVDGGSTALDYLREFNDVFENNIALQQAREAARADADLADLLRPPKTDEDRVARAISRIQAGVFDTPRPSASPPSPGPWS
jgi:hypothetical protein